MSVAIELSGLTKHFGAKVAVKDVSFSVGQGQCYGLIGPNGAGKTTTFSMMCGYLFPTAGTVRVMGVDPAEPGALRGKVGVLPQDAVLPATWPVGELLTWLGTLSGLPDAQAEAKRVLERVSLSETWGVQAGALSHGMAKRVAMAQALMGRPPVIFLDEPTAGLDPKIAAAIRQLIRELKGEHTVVVSSHNLQELEELCDATAILDKGTLVTAASITEITGQGAEVRVLLAKPGFDVGVVRGVTGVQQVSLEGDGRVLVVRYVGAPEEVISATLLTVLQRGGQVLQVTRGQRLEDKVLQLT